MQVQVPKDMNHALLLSQVINMDQKRGSQDVKRCQYGMQVFVD